MKNIQRILLTCLLLSFFTAGYTQTQFPNKDGEWYVVEDLGDNFKYSYPPFKIVGDTTIEGNSYDVMECRDVIRCAIRSIGTKVYCIMLNFPEYGENLIYDFGLNKWDSITLNHFYDPLSGYVHNIDTVVWYVLEIDNVLINGEIRKRIKLDSKVGLDYWIEGIGSTACPLPILAFNYSYHSTYLHCYREGETGFYGNCNNVGIKKTSAEQDLLVFDSSHKLLHINSSLKTGQNSIFIYNLLGKLVWQRKKINEDHLDLSFLKPGLYMCHITLAEKNQIKRIVIH